MNNIHPEFERQLPRDAKEKLLGQKGLVIWLCGMSGSGKSTIANAAERVLHAKGRMTAILDGDNLRTGINKDLGFSDADRRENIRRTAHIAKVMAAQGIVTFVSVITPRREFRDMARDVIGDDFFEVHVKASYDACEERDVKGLYAKAAAGQIENFTGRDSGFEEPVTPDLRIDTEDQEVEESAITLLEAVNGRIKHS
ncbi:adenylyl-sulfate kinase [Persicirhabdus sediminis]|uniref:Adenylyl-sulfate kinase n=1 Tax=Persicirhabdus sediminis TaxID=454144 RepID=A0A8J7MH87_9BACT|nr:adenylyl-sulfate kinase [Persicirhabdus sediminis]MBK1792788.1 adenylyl-sulfate kinase [Persicirhabdus sediminis]